MANRNLDQNRIYQRIVNHLRRAQILLENELESAHSPNKKETRKLILEITDYLLKG